MIRAVLDTNVIVSGLIKEGSPPGWILKALFEHQFVLITTAVFLAEVARVLAYPKIRERYHVNPEAADALIASLILLSEPVKVPTDVLKASRDPDDDIFLMCAVSGRADYLVTGDQDLLSLISFRRVEIVTPDQFVRVLRS